MRTCLLVIAATFAVAVPPSARADAASCRANYSTEGSFLAGKRFKTWDLLPAVPPDAAYRRAYAALIKEGWNIVSSDKDVGAISASTEVSYSDGKNAPLAIMVEPQGQGSKVSITFSISGGLMAMKVQDTLCGLMAQIENL